MPVGRTPVRNGVRPPPVSGGGVAVVVLGAELFPDLDFNDPTIYLYTGTGINGANGTWVVSGGENTFNRTAAATWIQSLATTPAAALNASVTAGAKYRVTGVTTQTQVGTGLQVNLRASGNITLVPIGSSPGSYSVDVVAGTGSGLQIRPSGSGPASGSLTSLSIKQIM